MTAVKAASVGTKPEAGRGWDAIPEGAGAWRKAAGGGERQSGGAMGARNGAPLTVSINTL